MKKNQFWKGIFLGAIAGGALSLLDKDTREAMKENVLTVSGKVGYMVKNPGETTRRVKETAIKIKETFEQVSEEVSYITEKVEELRELTPQVTDILKETKNAFAGENEEELLEEMLAEKQTDY